MGNPKGGKVCWGAAATTIPTAALWWEHGFTFGRENAHFDYTQNVGGQNNFINPPALWDSSLEMRDDSICSTWFIPHKYRKANTTFDVDLWVFDTDDGSLPDTFEWECGVRLLKDDENMQQAIAVTSSTKTINANYDVYNVQWRGLSFQGDAAAGERIAWLKLTRPTDVLSGDPLSIWLKVGYLLE